VGDANAGRSFGDLRRRYRHLLVKVRNGLAIAAASCKGSGVGLQGRRFKHFRCGVTSEVLEIPTPVLDNWDRELPTVTEGPPRIVGPFEAQLEVHVTGKAAIAYLQLAR